MSPQHRWATSPAGALPRQSAADSMARGRHHRHDFHAADQANPYAQPLTKTSRRIDPGPHEGEAGSPRRAIILRSSPHPCGGPTARSCPRTAALRLHDLTRSGKSKNRVAPLRLERAGAELGLSQRAGAAGANVGRDDPEHEPMTSTYVERRSCRLRLAQRGRAAAKSAEPAVAIAAGAHFTSRGQRRPRACGLRLRFDGAVL